MCAAVAYEAKISCWLSSEFRQIWYRRIHLSQSMKSTNKQEVAVHRPSRIILCTPTLNHGRYILIVYLEPQENAVAFGLGSFYLSYSFIAHCGIREAVGRRQPAVVKPP